MNCIFTWLVFQYSTLLDWVTFACNWYATLPPCCIISLIYKNLLDASGNSSFTYNGMYHQTYTLRFREGDNSYRKVSFSYKKQAILCVCVCGFFKVFNVKLRGNQWYFCNYLHNLAVEITCKLIMNCDNIWLLFVEIVIKST